MKQIKYENFKTTKVKYKSNKIWTSKSNLAIIFSDELLVMFLIRMQKNVQ